MAFLNPVVKNQAMKAGFTTGAISGKVEVIVKMQICFYSGTNFYKGGFGFAAYKKNDL